MYGIMMTMIYNFKIKKALIIIAATVYIVGCASQSITNQKSNVEPVIQNTTPEGVRTLSQKDLNHIIDAKLSRQIAASYLKNIRIDDYNLQEPNTNWSHTDIGGSDGKYSIYYFTYRQRYFLLLLKDGEDRISDCIDLVIMLRPSPNYELGMGKVEVDNNHFDGKIVVVYNKNWTGNYSDDIVAAYRLDLETKRIEEISHNNIRIYRDL